MDSRLDLQSKLEELLESKNVYYQPPENIKMNYPAIVYSKTNIGKQNANDEWYRSSTRYKVTVIDRLPNNKVINKLLRLRYCSYDTNYISDNLYHDVLTLYN